VYTVALVITDITKIAKRINWPVKGWPTNCYAVAVAIHQAKLVPAKSACRYGVWWGPMRSKTHFRNQTFAHHGWIELPDKRIYDPTRFVFENAKPYIWIGENTDGYYDIAGQRLNQQFYEEFPARKEPGILITEAQRRDLAIFMPSVMEENPDFGQMMWMAHYPTDKMGDKAKRIIQIFEELKLSALVPLDVRRYVLENDSLNAEEKAAARKRMAA
jgi:hypothetical protein